MKLEDSKSEVKLVLSWPAVAPSDEGREVGGARDADLLVGCGGAAFGGGDVRTALEELRGKAGRDDGRRVGEWQRGGWQAEGCGRLSDEDGDGVLVLCTRDGDVGGLDLGVLKLGLCLGEVGLYGNAAEVAVVGDANGFGVLRDGVVEEFLLGVGGAELEVVHGDFCLKR